MASRTDTALGRLYPSLTNTSYLVLRARRLIFSTWISELGDRPLKVLDVGGRYQPYRQLLGSRVAKYVVVDVKPVEQVTIIADGQALPFAAESFDLVIATQVFEFFANPQLAARQMHRVLRPGGVLLASVAAFVPRMVDLEQWRFTPAGIRSTLAPFSKVEIVPEVYSIGGLLRAMNVALNIFVRYDKARFVYRHTASPVLNLLGLGLEKLKLTSNDQFTGNYSVRATRG